MTFLILWPKKPGPTAGRTRVSDSKAPLRTAHARLGISRRVPRPTLAAFCLATGGRLDATNCGVRACLGLRSPCALYSQQRYLILLAPIPQVKTWGNTRSLPVPWEYGGVLHSSGNVFGPRRAREASNFLHAAWHLHWRRIRTIHRKRVGR